MNEEPPELRGASQDSTPQTAFPTWVRVTALVALIAMLAFVIWSAF